MARVAVLPVPLAAAPVPLSVAVCGLLGALSVKVNAAVRVPDVVGSKRMVTAQLEEAARLVPQLF
jgi:hypothetical protein